MDVNFQSKSPGLPKKTPLFIIPKLGFDICNTFLIIRQRRNYKVDNIAKKFYNL